MRVWLVYIRKSVVRNDTDLESPERQLYICKTRLEIGETEPYTIEIYQDLDRSGSTESGRPEWLRLKEQISRPEVAGVVASSLDRLYRNVSEFLKFLTEIETHGKVLITAKESLDTSSPLGRFVVTILMALFEMEWRLTSARMMDMIDDKRRRQGRHWGVTPFGCDRDGNGHLIPSERAYNLDGEDRYYHDALTECFRVYAGGQYSYEQVAAFLNGNGWLFHDRRGIPCEWTEERVRGVINRWRLYRGELPLGNPLKNHKQVKWLDGGHQPILPTELCDAVGSTLEERGKFQWSKVGQVHRVYPLSGILYCGACRMALKGQYQNGRLYRHEGVKGDCSENWAASAETVEAEVFDALTELLDHPEILDNIRMRLSQLGAKAPDNRRKIEDINGRLARLEDLYINEAKISKDNFLARRQELLNELVKLQPPPPANQDLSASVDQITASLYAIQDGEPKTKKALVSTVIQRLDLISGKVLTLTPKEWAVPFFVAASRAVYGPGGSRTQIARIPLIEWFNNSGLYVNQESEA